MGDPWAVIHIKVKQFLFLIKVNSVQSLEASGGHEGQFSKDPLLVFSAEGPCEQFWHEEGCPFFDAVHPAFHLLTTATPPPPQGALKDHFGEAKAVMVCDMPEPKFSSHDSHQKRFLWTHKEVDLALHPVIGIVPQVGDTEKYPHALLKEFTKPAL